MKIKGLLLSLAIIAVFLIGAFPVLPVHATGVAYVGGSAAGGSAVSSIVVNYGSSAGNTIFVMVGYRNNPNSLTSVSDSGGSSYTRRIQFQPDSFRSFEAWTSPAGGSHASGTFTLTFAGPVAFVVVTVEEYSGVATFGGTFTNSDWSAACNPCAPTITTQLAFSGSFAVAYAGTPDNTCGAFVAGTGNMRHSFDNGGNGEGASIDNTGGTSVVTSTGNTVCTGIRWAAISIEAKPAGAPVLVMGLAVCSGFSVNCAYPDIPGVNQGPSSGSSLSADQYGNLIALVVCNGFSQFCNGSAHGFLVWSNDRGATWNSCVAINGVQGDCTTGTTTDIVQNSGSTCIHAAAMYVSGATVDVGYAHNFNSNAGSHLDVDRFTIAYSGTSITGITNTGPETIADVSDQTTTGFTCVQQILPTPNGGGEIMVFAVEENSGPLYMFRTGVTTSAYKNLAGVSSAVSSTLTSQNDGSNSCSQFMPVTGDIWNLDVYDRAGFTTFSNGYVYNSGTGNWGAETSFANGGNTGVPVLTKSLSCTVDTTHNRVYWSWFNCTKAGGAECTTGAPAAGDTCRWVLWDATTSSSIGQITQLASFNDHTGAPGSGSCHQPQSTGGGSLTFVKGKLWLTGRDDNMFGTGCPSEGGSDNSKCQQIFYAKYDTATTAWGSLAQYPNAATPVLGVSAFTNSAGDFNLVYTTCSNWVGTSNGNDGQCVVITGKEQSLWWDPIPAPFAATVKILGPNTVLIGSIITYQAVVTGNTPTGTVAWTTTFGSFSGSPCTLSSGSCFVTFTAPDVPGQAVFTAAYSGDSNNAASTGNLTVKVVSSVGSPAGQAALAFLILLLFFGAVWYARRKATGGGGGGKRGGRGFRL